MSELTLLFAQAGEGDAQALDRIFTLLYDDLALMARARLRRSERMTLADTGALVHESWLRLQRAGALQFENRGHFLAHAARVMRSVITDIARKSLAERRGGAAATRSSSRSTLPSVNPLLPATPTCWMWPRPSTSLPDLNPAWHRWWKYAGSRA